MNHDENLCTLQGAMANHTHNNPKPLMTNCSISIFPTSLICHTSGFFTESAYM